MDMHAPGVDLARRDLGAVPRLHADRPRPGLRQDADLPDGPAKSRFSPVEPGRRPNPHLCNTTGRAAIASVMSCRRVRMGPGSTRSSQVADVSTGRTS